MGVTYSVIGREELHRGLIQYKDLIIAVGGDGTILNTSSFLDDSIPLLGVNSDPTRPEEEGVTKLKDETNIIFSYVKPTGQTSYGFIIPDNLSPEVLANIDIITENVKRKLLSDQSSPIIIGDLTGGSFGP
jgi:hypothetical protein